jgi:hypothetical protein
MVTFGFVKGPKEYYVKNTETGEKKTVWADNSKQVGDKIAKGRFMKK